MLKQILILVLVLIFITDADFIVKGKVKKRNTIIKINDNFPPRCFNNSVFRNNDTLKRIVFASKYIFTGKISSEQKRKRGKFQRVIFKVFVRRILKGDVGALSDILNFETRTLNSSNRAYLLAESSWNRRCSGSLAGQGWAALLFSGEEFSSPLKLLIEPVPTNLESIRRVKALIKGKNRKIIFSNVMFSVQNISLSKNIFQYNIILQKIMQKITHFLNGSHWRVFLVLPIVFWSIKYNIKSLNII